MSPQVEILSYFSLETDLAGQMKSSPEFVSGAGYEVELEGSGDERVSVRYVEGEDDSSDRVEVTGTTEGPLFDRVIGRVIGWRSAIVRNVSRRRKPLSYTSLLARGK